MSKKYPVQPHACCGAKTRSGGQCKNAPVTGKKKCRMHGGAFGSGAPLGNKRASLNMYKKASPDNHNKIMKSSRNEPDEGIIEDAFKTEYNYKNIICRCEQISEGEILRAYDDILSISAIPTLVGIKNRTRAGMGRCQGGFCQNRIINLLEKERGVDPESLKLFNKDSVIVQGRVR